MRMDSSKLMALAVGAGLLVTAGCASMIKTTPGICKEQFGTTLDGKPVELYTLSNFKGTIVKISNYGGIVVNVRVPDSKGNLGDVVLGYETLTEYLKESPYFGCLVGRYGNRIAKGKFSLNGQQYTLATNNYPNHLHGGTVGFDKVIWKARLFRSKQGPSLELKYTSKDGEEGYPGTLSVTALYTLTDKDELRLDYTATTDKDTVVNLTQHSYFNLAGGGSILGHEVMINASKFTPVDSTLIPTGELKPVDGTPFDFRKATTIGARINQDDQQLQYGKGYDHNWVIDKKEGELSLMARVKEPKSGRVLEVLSTEPGLQFYSGNFLDGSLIGKGNRAYNFRYGFCMEPQHFPDSPNQPSFPSVVLHPGKTYRNTIVYKFSVQ